MDLRERVSNLLPHYKMATKIFEAVVTLMSDEFRFKNGQVFYVVVLESNDKYNLTLSYRKGGRDVLWKLVERGTWSEIESFVAEYLREGDRYYEKLEGFLNQILLQSESKA
jgi:hypothetical protein